MSRVGSGSKFSKSGSATLLVFKGGLDLYRIQEKEFRYGLDRIHDWLPSNKLGVEWVRL